MDRNPVEESRQPEVCDGNHDAEQKNEGVPIDGLIGAVKREYLRQHHGDRAAKGRGGAVEIARRIAFHSDQNISDEENADRDPVDRAEDA